jgi:hypothetical protein
VVGGIGNQLFCYAAARRLALRNNAELVIDDVSGFLRDPYERHYELEKFDIAGRKASRSERLEPFPRFRRALKRRLSRVRRFENRSYLQQEGKEFDERILQLNREGTLHIEGYWQSEDYFKDVEDVIRSDLRVRTPIDKDNIDLARRIRLRPSVAVHVRFFDEPTATDTANASVNYYEQSVAKMETQVADAHYFVFSDRPNFARARIPLPDDRVTCVAHNQGDNGAVKDLFLMTQCQHFIIANSTFSWWGAWLGGSDDSLVLAPHSDRFDKDCGYVAQALIPGRWKML